MYGRLDVAPTELMEQSGVLGEQTEALQASVESDKPEERIAARRLRVAARNQAKNRQDLEDDTKEEKTKEEPRTSQNQLEQSERRMTELCDNGTKLVTNIRVAVDAREAKRRTELQEAKRLRNEKVDNEAKSSLEQFEELTRKWTVSKEKEIPQDLRDALTQQQQLCDLIIEEKNKLIYELQQELKVSDDCYVKDLKKQAENVNLMIERMQGHIKSLKKTYREELDLIEKSFDDERNTLVTKNRKKWEQQRQERSGRELELLIQRMKRVEEYEVLLQRLRMEDMEEYNMIKMELEPDVQLLEQQLQMVKATNQLNQEKLEYNYQVLKKRIEENTITKAEQKRKITKLQDALHNLKIKCINQEKQMREENQLLVDSYERAMQQYKDMQKRMRQFAAIDAKRFEEVWQMNEAEAKALVQRALDIDRVIHEQQLGLTWTPPSMTFMERSGPFQVQGSAQQTSHWVAAQALGGEEEERNEMERSGGPERSTTRVDRKTVKRLLELLCDETGFLIESKLLTILSSLEKDERSLMKLNSIFNALGIKNEEDIYKMAEFFAQYQQQQGEDSLVYNQGKAGTETDINLIHPNDVLKALRTFTEQHCRPRGIHQECSVMSLEERGDSGDAAYWESIANVLPESKLKMWGALDGALDKYHTVLKDRSKLVAGVQHLKQQNSELRKLLQQYHFSGQP